MVIKHAAVDQLNEANSSHVVKTTQADIDKLSRFNNDPEGTALLAGTSKNNLIFQLPFSPLATIPDGIKHFNLYLFPLLEQQLFQPHQDLL